MLVEVKAASINQLDEKIRLGEFKQILPYQLPLDPRQRPRRHRRRVGLEGARVQARRRGLRPAGQGPGSAPSPSALPSPRPTSRCKPASVTCPEAAAAAPGRADRLAGARRAGQRAARAEGPHPRRRRRSRIDRDPARQAPRRDRRDHRQRKRRLRARARRRHWSSTTAPRTSNELLTATTSSWTASAATTSKSHCASCGPAARRSASPARPIRHSPARSASTHCSAWRSPASAAASAARRRSWA